MPRTPAIALLAVCLLPAACARNGNADSILASGHVEATDVRVATKIGGTLARLDLEEGDRLTRGQTIAQIDTVDLKLARDAAAADRGAADAHLRLLLAGSRAEDIAAAEAQVARDRAELDAAQRDFDRFQGLLDTGSGTQKTRDDARTRRDVAEKVLQAAQDQLAKLRAGPRPEEIDAARARLAEASARIAQIDQQIKDATVVSPTGGVVTEKLVEPGELLAPATALAVVTDLADAWLTAYVGEAEVGRLRLGQQARVVTDDGTERTGTLTFVNSEAEFTPKNVQTKDERVKLVYRIKIALPNEDGFYKPGMPAEAHLAAAPASANARKG